MDIIDFIDRGGMLVYILVSMNIIGFAIMILKFFSLLQFKKNIKHTAIELSKNISNKDQLYIESQIEEQIKKLESGLGTIKIIASTAPLLGLLGTVFGILLTFDTISQTGMNDPLSFSGGISIALITTVVGLVVAIPHHIYYNYYIGALDSLEIKLKNEILHTK